ncbi:MAG: hypothetical protein U0L06_03715 [Agathobacter sp.]|nr:hypothetical protein [Agathobacter sp.]
MVDNTNTTVLEQDPEKVKAEYRKNISILLANATKDIEEGKLRVTNLDELTNLLELQRILA